MGFLLCVLLTLGAAPLFSLGQEEDPNQILAKTFDLPDVRFLEIRGEIQFTLAPGPKPKITVETTRALFDQLNVSDWWGRATVAIESGLRGPREKGTVKINIFLPSLEELTVSDRSSGSGTWPGPPTGAGRIKVYEQSSLTLTATVQEFGADVSWLSLVVLNGQTGTLDANLRHQAKLVADGLKTGSTNLFLDEASTFEGGEAITGTGTVRHGSKVTVPAGEDWSQLVLKEDSVKVDRAPAAP